MTDTKKSLKIPTRTVSSNAKQIGPSIMRSIVFCTSVHAHAIDAITAIPI